MARVVRRVRKTGSIRFGSRPSQKQWAHEWNDCRLDSRVKQLLNPRRSEVRGSANMKGPSCWACLPLELRRGFLPQASRIVSWRESNISILRTEYSYCNCKRCERRTSRGSVDRRLGLWSLVGSMHRRHVSRRLESCCNGDDAEELRTSYACWADCSSRGRQSSGVPSWSDRPIERDYVITPGRFGVTALNPFRGLRNARCCHSAHSAGRLRWAEQWAQPTSYLRSKLKQNSITHYSVLRRTTRSTVRASISHHSAEMGMHCT